jgi:hypothetical protein
MRSGVFWLFSCRLGHVFLVLLCMKLSAAATDHVPGMINLLGNSSIMSLIRGNFRVLIIGTHGIQLVHCMEDSDT